MGPKTAKQPEKAASKDETLVFYVEIKFNDVCEKIAVNSSCRMDIVADFVKRSFVKLLLEKIAGLAALENAVNNDLIQSLRDYQTALVNVSAITDIILQDTQNVNVAWQEVRLLLQYFRAEFHECIHTQDPSKSGLLCITPLSTYKLGVIKADKSQFMLYN